MGHLHHNRYKQKQNRLPKKKTNSHPHQNNYKTYFSRFYLHPFISFQAITHDLKTPHKHSISHCHYIQRGRRRCCLQLFRIYSRYFVDKTNTHFTFGNMKLFILFLVLFVVLRSHPCSARPTGDCAIEKSDQLLNETAKFIDIEQTTTAVQETDDEKSGKMIIAEDVELVPPYDSRAARRGKSVAGSIVGAALEVSKPINKYINWTTKYYTIKHGVVQTLCIYIFVFASKNGMTCYCFLTGLFSDTDCCAEKCWRFAADDSRINDFGVELFF